MNNQARRALSLRDGQLQCCAHQLRMHARRHRPAHDLAGAQVQHHRQVKPAARVRMQVMSLTQAWLGPLGLKRRAQATAAINTATGGELSLQLRADQAGLGRDLGALMGAVITRTADAQLRKLQHLRLAT